jgi:hypothetical protein
VIEHSTHNPMIEAGNTKGGSIPVPLTSCLTGLDYPVLQIKTKNVSYHTADSKPVKQVNGTVILHPLVYSLMKVQILTLPPGKKMAKE